MTTTMDFYFDFVSPTAYLAFKIINQIKKDYDLKVNGFPVLLGGLIKASNNVSPITVPAKLAYSMGYDLPRYAKLYNVDMNPNPYFPINTLPLVRGALAAKELGIFDEFCTVIFDAIWVEKLNMGDPTIILQRLAEAGIDGEKLIALTQEPQIKQALIENTESACKRGAFGVPTMFINNDMFFGQDRLFFIEKMLKNVS